MQGKSAVKILRICLYSLVLVSGNMAGVFIGFIVYRLLESADQLVIQVPVAAVLSIVAFVAWNWLVWHFPFKALFLQKEVEFLWTYVASLLWAPLIFVPLHCVTQGYLTSVGNILAVLFFQLPINSLAVGAAIVLGFSKIGSEA